MSNFGYSDDDFVDYSWFRNAVDNSGGENCDEDGGGGGSNSPFNNSKGKWVVRVIVILAVLLVLDFLFDGMVSRMLKAFRGWVNDTIFALTN